MLHDLQVSWLTTGTSGLALLLPMVQDLVFHPLLWSKNLSLALAFASTSHSGVSLLFPLSVFVFSVLLASLQDKPRFKNKLLAIYSSPLKGVEFNPILESLDHWSACLAPILLLTWLSSYHWFLTLNEIFPSSTHITLFGDINLVWLG